MAQAAAMVAAGRGGAIVNVSSQMGHVGGPRRAVYCMTKHAMEALTKAMALDLAPHGVRVNAAAPPRALPPAPPCGPRGRAGALPRARKVGPRRRRAD
jgi:NAD(P)-dependent dehydrogenase (short-subunit alcohol dehydrogenase family)